MNVHKRIAYVDAAKAIGIIVVVLGHIPALPPEFSMLIYSFHMPLFFFISGYLQPPGRPSLSLPQLLSKSARTLFIPYVFFFVISLLYWLATRGIGQRAEKFEGVTIWDAFEGLFTGLSADLFVNPTLWFFPCLFVCTVVYALLRSRLSARWCLFLATSVAACIEYSLPWEMRLPLGMDIGLIALLFYAAGAALRDSGWTPTRVLRPWLCVLIPLFTVAWAYMALEQGRVDLAFANFGDGLPEYVATALLGIGLVFLVSVLLPHNRVTVWLADNSLIIFPLHVLWLNFASGVFKFLKVDGLAHAHVAATVALLFVWVMVASAFASYVLRKKFSFFLGRSSSLSLKRQ